VKLAQPAAARKFDLPLFRFPLRGQTGAGGFPPRRKARCAPANRAVPCMRLPPQEGCAPLCIPCCFCGSQELCVASPRTFFPAILLWDANRRKSPCQNFVAGLKMVLS
jgi:hypothetical protein